MPVPQLIGRAGMSGRAGLVRKKSKYFTICLEDGYELPQRREANPIVRVRGTCHPGDLDDEGICVNWLTLSPPSKNCSSQFHSSYPCSIL